ncbi:hypothetical protein SKAU_G00286230 [Synaphobranchus kaupii]|uniref:Uncharacterized protein n=1 Tax=Synaphobranchus kaupii TaxID=118154 RepID=A0A9Q1EY40_SYNKA|nr:hypothetical protein SKAU_G00286230 [Synaphobranchus kaupii]
MEATTVEALEEVKLPEMSELGVPVATEGEQGGEALAALLAEIGEAAEVLAGEVGAEVEKMPQEAPTLKRSLEAGWGERMDKVEELHLLKVVEAGKMGFPSKKVRVGGSMGSDSDDSAGGVSLEEDSPTSAAGFSRLDYFFVPGGQRVSSVEVIPLFVSDHSGYDEAQALGSTGGKGVFKAGVDSERGGRNGEGGGGAEIPMGASRGILSICSRGRTEVLEASVVEGTMEATTAKALEEVKLPQTSELGVPVTTEGEQGGEALAALLAEIGEAAIEGLVMAAPGVAPSTGAEVLAGEVGAEVEEMPQEAPTLKQSLEAGWGEMMDKVEEQHLLKVVEAGKMGFPSKKVKVGVSSGSDSDDSAGGVSLEGDSPTPE